MKKRVLFLIVVALWIFEGASTSVLANGYCGDWICQDQPCHWGGGTEACEERMSCPSDCQ